MTVDTASGSLQGLAQALNAACQCIWLDRDRLRSQLEARFAGLGTLLDQRAGLISGGVVFLDTQDAMAMDRTAALVHAALTSPAYQGHVAQLSPLLSGHAAAAADCMLGFDFHLGGAVPQLIEINTNPGGLLINLELAQALTACCDCIAAPLAQLAAGNVALDELPARITDHFHARWRDARGAVPLRAIAVVDDDPAAQYLYPEFVLYQRLFEQAGWHTLIVDPAALENRDGALFAEGQRVDMVYNRLTDFYLAEDRHAALRQAYETGSAVITPYPAAHAHWADKRLLAWLRDEELLRSAGLDADSRAHLLRTIPPTEIVGTEAAEGLWQRRKELFFKPVAGYGSKAAYRGDKLTRKTF